MESVDQKQVCFQKVTEPANEWGSALLISQISVGVFLTARVAGRQKPPPLPASLVLFVFERERARENERARVKRRCLPDSDTWCGIWHKFLRCAVSVLSNCTGIEMGVGGTAWPPFSYMTGLIPCGGVGMVKLLGREKQQGHNKFPICHTSS